MRIRSQAASLCPESLPRASGGGRVSGRFNGGNGPAWVVTEAMPHHEWPRYLLRLSSRFTEH
ncbi:MAG: hypothetical protein LBV45_02155 [Xanthomonadaceae bacterium]|nr:hypothetical protein [Xanthomonadaceae bacterium]